jgi:hypothetical protein
MTFIPHQQEKHCFIACSEDKVNAGLCDCINRMRNEALRQPLVIGSVCTCTKFRETPMINDKHICSICNKPIVQTDL